MFGKKKKMNAQDQVVLSEQHDSEYVLEVSDLVVHYELENETVEAVNGISLRLKKGETIGLAGETGAGKSIIIDAISCMLGFRTSREIIKAGCETAFVEGMFYTDSQAVNDCLTTNALTISKMSSTFLMVMGSLMLAIVRVR